LRAAYGVIAQEKRVAFRHDVQIGASPVTLELENGQRPLSNVSVVNLSKMGLGLQTREMLPQGATLQISFLLPESGDVMNVTGTVMWSRDNGQAGVNITNISPSHQKKLHAWIESKLPPDFDFMPRSNTQASLRDAGIALSVPQRQEIGV